MKYTIKDLEKDFPNDQACLEAVFNILHKRECSCGGQYKPIKGRKQYQCGRCRFQIAPTANTIFHKSDTKLTMWFHAIFIFCHAKSGISAMEMQRQLGVTYKCAWRILSQIRKALDQDKEKLKGTVEIDSAYIGGHKSAKISQAHAIAEKTIVIAALERGGKMRAKVVGGLGGRYVKEFLKENVNPKTTIMTDSSPTYGRYMKSYKQKSVNHSKEWSRRGVHINAIEAFFGHIKRSTSGTFKTVSSKHLQTYLDAFVFHYNNRHNDRERFSCLLGALLPSSK